VRFSFLEGWSPIDLVSTCGFHNVELYYASDCDRLIMGHFEETYEPRVVVIKLCSTLNHVVCGAKGTSIEGIRVTQGYCGVENYGVVLRLDDRRWYDDELRKNHNITLVSAPQRFRLLSMLREYGAVKLECRGLLKVLKKLRFWFYGRHFMLESA
jgi:hypothetical protein